MITTIIGKVEFKKDYLLLGTVLGVLKTDDGPLDLTLSPGISRISLVKRTLPIKYDSTIENQLDNLGVLGEVETFNNQFPTVVKGYRDELFKFNDLPKHIIKQDWLKGVQEIKNNLVKHVIECGKSGITVTFKLAASDGEQCINAVITSWLNDILHVRTAHNLQFKVSLDHVISITYGG